MTYIEQLLQQQREICAKAVMNETGIVSPILNAPSPSIDISKLEGMKWVKASERLPEVGNFSTIEVLALCGGNRAYVLDFITNNDGTPGKFYLSINYPTRVFSDFTKHVTHWQPLPPSPTEKTLIEQKP
jgi:hypothetical protein